MSPALANEDALAILDDYDFELPESSIAQNALAQRDAARLLVVDRESGALFAPESEYQVRDLRHFLGPNDLLIVNATRVLPARLVGRKATGGAAEALLLGAEPISRAADGSTESPDGRGPRFRALLKCTGRVRVGLELVLGRSPGNPARVEAIHDRGEVSLRFAPGSDPYALGEAPLPPYIRRDASQPGDEDLERYQTVYARAPGAIAAPTAGLHFTSELFDALRSGGTSIAEVVLHVGAGTFRPLDAEALQSGRLHAEVYELPSATAEAIARTRGAGGRIVAVGTTTARVLESCCDDQGQLAAGRGQTRLFMRPGGAPFRVVDALLTNFHLPRSSLLLLVAAFVGRESLLAAYRHAIGAGYRFYSYGDAMLITPRPGAAQGA
ncbi:MAG: tRNA preQ1(34) S-adenosylmethionine ribosyltransferase-isomerase QueA [bacterium]|nr:tRNA preQ1(34) S-adenosylmethionine ribosyltransferase-isomerase QueA [Deltaproteobacteria bacterium]MCP4908175.1 tRNA preQ1(34) S-adenosylmethionine ribosyltransferase-isomerase QueA [bacterium]